jgi:hypothetical protein
MGGERGFVLGGYGNVNLSQRWHNSYSDESDYNHAEIEAGAHLQNLIGRWAELMVGVSLDGTNQNEIGAWRLLASAKGGSSAHLFCNIHGRAMFGVSGGAGTYQSYAGESPDLGPDLLGSLDLSIFTKIEMGNYDVMQFGLGAKLAYSPIQDYFQMGFGIRFNWYDNPIVANPEASCHEELIPKLENLYSKLRELAKLREELVLLDADNQAVMEMIGKLIDYQSRVGRDAKNFCEVETQSAQVSYSAPPILDFPILLTPEPCKDKLKEVSDVSGVIEFLTEEYQNLLKQLKEGGEFTTKEGEVVRFNGRDDLRSELQRLLNASPLQCYPFPYPPKYILFANDNPDLPLQPQWRPSVGKGNLKLYANPVLDEVIAYLRDPDNRQYKVQLIGIANETSEVKGDPHRDKRLAEERVNGAFQYMTLNGYDKSDPKQCESFTIQEENKELKKPEIKGIACKYEYRNQSFRTHPNNINSNKAELYTEKGTTQKSDGTFDSNQKMIGGAILHPDERDYMDPKKEHVKQVVLPDSQVCKPQAYAASELFDKEGHLLPQAKAKFPTWTWELKDKSPIFRTVLIEIVEKCPDQALMEGAAQTISE